MHTIITAAQKDPSKLSLNKLTKAEKNNLEAIQNLSEKVPASWTPPAVDNINWDGKLMNKADICLVVFASFQPFDLLYFLHSFFSFLPVASFPATVAF